MIHRTKGWTAAWLATAGFVSSLIGCAVDQSANGRIQFKVDQAEPFGTQVARFPVGTDEGTLRVNNGAYSIKGADLTYDFARDRHLTRFTYRDMHLVRSDAVRPPPVASAPPAPAVIAARIVSKMSAIGAARVPPYLDEAVRNGLTAKAL